MNAEMDMQLEMLRFAEMVALAELEESKAAGRVKEIRYQAARYQMQYITEIVKAQQQAEQQAAAQQQPQQKAPNG